MAALDFCSYFWMQKLSLSDQLYTLVARVFYHRQADRSWCNYVEFYCGHGNFPEQQLMGVWKAYHLILLAS